MVDVTPFLPGLSSIQGKTVVARFDGGQLSSEGGLLALREIKRRLATADRFAACLKDPRMPEKVVHGLAEIIRFRVLMIVAGYEDGNDADTLRRDTNVTFVVNRRTPD
jgi:DDE family transposase